MNKIIKKIKAVSKKVTKSHIFLALGLGLIGISIFPELASADIQPITNLGDLSTKVKNEVQGDGLKITLNVVGIGCIIYSVFNGFNKGVLVLGGLIIAYANVFFGYVNGLFN